MKIAYIDLDDIQNPLLGAGQARATYQVASRLAKMKHTVTVYCSNYLGAKDRIQDGINYKHIGIATPWIKVNNALFILAVPFVARALTCDIIIESFAAPVSTLLSPLFTKIPVIALPSMFRADEFARKYHLPFDVYEKIGFKFYKYITPYSSIDEAKAKRLNPQIKTKIIGQGVGPEFFKIPRNSPKHILFMGRLDIWQKGIDLLLESYAKVADKIKYPLVIAGHGPDKKKVEDLISKFGLQDKVELIGPIYDAKKSKVFSESLFVAFPSRHDEMCLATLEVLAAGLPVICFDIPESTWITSKVSVKTPAFDTNKYAQALLKSSSPNIVNKLRSQARPFAKNFSWDNVAHEFDTFIREIVKL